MPVHGRAGRRTGRRAGTVIAALAALVVAFGAGVVVGRQSDDDGARERATEGTTAPVTEPAVEEEPTVAVFGDSLVSQAGPYLEAIDETLGLVAVVRSFPGAAPCDAVQVLRDDLPPDVDVVVWAFSGNRASGCMLDAEGRPLDAAASLEAYRRHTEEAIGIVRDVGARFVLATPPALRDADEFTSQVDLLYRSMAMEDLAVQYVDAGIAITPGGEFATTTRCLPFEAHLPPTEATCNAPTDTISVRGDDGTHFCVADGCDAYASGAMRYAINLLAAARLQLDLRVDLSPAD